MIFSPNTIRNSAFAETFLKQYRKQKLKLLSATHWLDEVGDYSGTQRPKYVLESDGSAVINSSHITSQTVTSKKGTASATVSTGQIDIGSGWISEIVLSDGTVYFLEESSGTNFYDSSGAGNDATLTGTGTWAIKRDLTLINNANKYGYTLTGNVIIPVDLSNLANNAEGDALQFVGRVASDMKFVESRCIELNGTNGGGTLNFVTSFTSEFFVEEYLEIDDITGHLYAHNIGNNNSFSRIYLSVGAVGFSTTNSGSGVETSTAIIQEGDKGLFRFRMYIDASVVKLDISKDSVLLGTAISTQTAISFNLNVVGLKRGQATSVGLFKGKRYGLNINGANLFPIAESSGTTSYAFEDSTKTITWSGGATWTTQDEFHHNITQGFSVSGLVKLPYKVAGVYSNPAGNGNNVASNLKQVVFREDFGTSSLHFDQSDLSSNVITYNDLENTANVFLDTFPKLKINLETFSPAGIINQSNRQNNGLRRNKDTFFRTNE